MQKHFWLGIVAGSAVSICALSVALMLMTPQISEPENDPILASAEIAAPPPEKATDVSPIPEDGPTKGAEDTAADLAPNSDASSLPDPAPELSEPANHPATSDEAQSAETKPILRLPSSSETDAIVAKILENQAKPARLEQPNKLSFATDDQQKLVNLNTNIAPVDHSSITIGNPVEPINKDQPIISPSSKVKTSPEQDEPPVDEEKTPIKASKIITNAPQAPNSKITIGNSNNTLILNSEKETETAKSEQPKIAAIVRNSIKFHASATRPLMSVLLRDTGPARVDILGLQNLPFAVSVIINATQEDAAEAIQFYKAAGFEIVIEADLPPGATPVDAEVNFQVQANMLDQGVAIFIPEESSFQNDSDLAGQVSEILAVSGHGLISTAKGLNTGHKIAKKQGLDTAVVFRELDKSNQDSRVIRRFLDSAAFKARQAKEPVILLGKIRLETVKALIEWAVGSRAKTVTMAPVSAVLTQN